MIKSGLVWSRGFRRRHLGRRVTAVTHRDIDEAISNNDSHRTTKYSYHEAIEFRMNQIIFSSTKAVQQEYTYATCNSCTVSRLIGSSLLWRHNGRDGVSNQQHHDCLLNRLFRRRYKNHQSSPLLALVQGSHRWPVNSPYRAPVTRKMFPFDDVIILFFVMFPFRFQREVLCYLIFLGPDVRPVVDLISSDFTPLYFIWHGVLT